jgi:hypothetical protein
MLKQGGGEIRKILSRRGEYSISIRQRTEINGKGTPRWRDTWERSMLSAFSAMKNMREVEEDMRKI